MLAEIDGGSSQVRGTSGANAINSVTRWQNQKFAQFFPYIVQKVSK